MESIKTSCTALLLMLKNSVATLRSGLFWFLPAPFGLCTVITVGKAEQKQYEALQILMQRLDRAKIN